MRKIIPVIVAIALLVSTAFAGYYFAIARPRQAEIDLELKKLAQEEERKRIYAECYKAANEAASELAKDKVEIGVLTGDAWEKAAEKDLFSKKDFDAYYDTCLKRYGIIE